MWLNEKESKRYFERQELLKAFAELFPYNEGDDRAIVIIGGSFLETLLEHILIEFFPDDKEVDRLLNYDQSLGSYGNRARMIYCLGLIEKLVYHDLKLIGKIRNKFAHDMRASFDDQQIQQWCSELKWHKAALTGFFHPMQRTGLYTK